MNDMHSFVTNVSHCHFNHSPFHLCLGRVLTPIICRVGCRSTSLKYFIRGIPRVQGMLLLEGG